MRRAVGLWPESINKLFQNVSVFWWRPAWKCLLHVAISLHSSRQIINRSSLSWVWCIQKEVCENISVFIFHMKPEEQGQCRKIRVNVCRIKQKMKKSNKSWAQRRLQLLLFLILIEAVCIECDFTLLTCTTVTKMPCIVILPLTQLAPPISSLSVLFLILFSVVTSTAKKIMSLKHVMPLIYASHLWLSLMAYWNKLSSTWWDWKVQTVWKSEKLQFLQRPRETPSVSPSP